MRAGKVGRRERGRLKFDREVDGGEEEKKAPPMGQTVFSAPSRSGVRLRIGLHSRDRQATKARSWHAGCSFGRTMPSGQGPARPTLGSVICQWIRPSACGCSCTHACSCRIGYITHTDQYVHNHVVRTTSVSTTYLATGVAASVNSTIHTAVWAGRAKKSKPLYLGGRRRRAL